MSLRHAILGVLEYHPLHGYALKRVLEEGISHVWPVNLAAIYPCLRRLEAEGLVTHTLESTPDGRPDRKVYTVTEPGRTEMAAWRRLPPDRSEQQTKSPFLLKLLFARRESLPEVREWIGRALVDLAAQRERAVGSLAEAERQPFFVRFLRESGLAHLDLQIERLALLRERVDDMLREDDSDRAPGFELGLSV